MKVPDIDVNEALVRTICCALCSSDAAKVNDDNVNGSIKIGHEYIGIVEKVGSEIEKIKIGDVITILHHIPCYVCEYCNRGLYTMCAHYKNTHLNPHGFSEYIKILPDHIEYGTEIITPNKNVGKYIFTEPISCCLRGIEKININKKDNIQVLIYGCGLMGLIFIALFKLLFNSFIIAIDIDDYRLNIAKRFGSDFNINTKKEDVDSIISNNSFINPDIIILTVVNQDTINKSISYIKKGGTIQIFTPSDKKFLLDFNNLFYKEIKVVASYSGTPETFKEAFSLIKENKLNFLSLITYKLNVEDFMTGVKLTLKNKAYRVIYYFNEELFKKYF